MTCPRCHNHVDRAQAADPGGDGAWIAYPCGHWLTADQAADLPATYQPREETAR